jgi:peroxiredoxin
MSSAGTIPEAGTEAPDFRLPSLAHGEVGPSDYRGRQKVVVAFYPKDNTSG